MEQLLGSSSVVWMVPPLFVHTFTSRLARLGSVLLMKDRAGRVGGRGVSDLLDGILAAQQPSGPVLLIRRSAVISPTCPTACASCDRQAGSR